MSVETPTRSLLSDVVDQKWFVVKHRETNDAIAVLQFPDVSGIHGRILHLAVKDVHLTPTAAIAHFVLKFSMAGDGIDLRCDWKGRESDSMAEILREPPSVGDKPIPTEPLTRAEAENLLLVGQVDWYQCTGCFLRGEKDTMHFEFVGKMPLENDDD